MTNVKGAAAILLHLLVTALLACSPYVTPIPPGRYTYGLEHVDVIGKQIRCYGRKKDPSSKGLWYRDFNYTVTRDGEILPRAATDVEAAYGVCGAWWYWDGVAIIRHSASTGEHTRFVLSVGRGDAASEIDPRSSPDESKEEGETR